MGFNDIRITDIHDTVVSQPLGRVYIVGGAVRDRIMGREPKDIDLLVTGIPLDTLKEILPGKVELVGASFGVLKVTIDGKTFDVALPRTEHSTGAGHKDFAVCTDYNLPVESDLARRDFTMNAIAYNLTDMTMIDPFGGEKDIEDKRIKCVGNPVDRFTEDPLRMLRALQFESRFCFGCDYTVLEAMKSTAHLLSTVSPERIQEELNKLLLGYNPMGAIRDAIEFGVFARIIPEFVACENMEQYNSHHNSTVGSHTLIALSYAAEKGASLRARWALLLHDIGKPHTFSIGSDGFGHFYGHEDVSADMADRILERLKFSTDDRKAIVKLVREHLSPGVECSDRALRRWLAAMGDLVEDALMVRESDVYAHKNGVNLVKDIDAIRARIPEIDTIKGFTEAQLAVDGNEIAKVFGVQGRVIGDYKKEAAGAVIDGVIDNEPEAVIEFLRSCFGKGS